MPVPVVPDERADHTRVLPVALEPLEVDDELSARRRAYAVVAAVIGGLLVLSMFGGSAAGPFAEQPVDATSTTLGAPTTSTSTTEAEEPVSEDSDRGKGGKGKGRR